MKIGIIGTGTVAQALAPKFAAAGHDLVLASRSPGEKSGLVFPVVSYPELKSADLIVVAVPGSVALNVLLDVGADVLSGKILLDVANVIKPDYSGIVNPSESLGSRIQAAFPTARVVKALNTFGTEVMVNPGSLKSRTNTFVSGNDPEAKAVVKDLHTALGWRPEEVLDLGDIGGALAQEHYFSFFLRLFPLFGHLKFNVAIVD